MVNADEQGLYKSALMHMRFFPRVFNKCLECNKSSDYGVWIKSLILTSH